jgi:translation initiation factor IF-3
MSISQQEEFRVNRQIRSPQVRLVFESRQLGVLSIERARKIAEDAGLDLVEVSSNTNPPVCKIIDYGKFRYEQQLKKKEQTKKQKDAQAQLKEIRLRPSIGKHDMDVKISQAKKFLESSMKVQFSLMFKGQRELSHKEQGFFVIKQILESLSSISTTEKLPKLDGSRIICILAPKPS